MPLGQNLVFPDDRAIYEAEDFINIGTTAFSTASSRLFIRSCDGWRLLTQVWIEGLVPGL